MTSLFAQRSSTILGNLSRRNLSLPLNSSTPLGSYKPFMRSGRLVFVSGQLPLSKEDNSLLTGPCTDSNLEIAQEAARLSALQFLAALRDATDRHDLAQVKSVLKVEGYLNCGTQNFSKHPEILNAASDLVCDILGREVGVHSRIAVGCSCLPRNAMIEVAGVAELWDEGEL